MTSGLPPAPVEIRPFRDADEPAVVSLWKSVFGYSAPHNNPSFVIRQKVAADPDLFLVAMDQGRLAGTIMGGYDGHRGWVYSLAVDPDYRRRGVGTALVRAVETALAARGCIKVNLQILAVNAEVVGFYTALGYHVEERVSMGKSLK